jgi:o-succinylbenzoate---CoA ligase
MNPITHLNLHPDFKLNGISLTKEDLYQKANHLKKTGAEFEQDFAHLIVNWFDDKTYFEVQTSGTTGKPKIIQVAKEAMVNSAIATGIFFNLKPGDKALNCLPVNYIAGKMMFVRAFVLGLDIDFIAASSNPLHRNETFYDFAGMVPLQVENSLSQLHQIKKLIIGGAKVNQSLEEKLIKNPCESYETYSMTETVTHIAAKRIGEKAFTVLPNVTIAQDNRQCLVISAPNLNAENIITNDLVEIISKKQFVWLGRFDNVINSGGIKLIPEQIEAKLSDNIPNRFFVAGMPDEKLGEKLVLVIEGASFNLADSVFSGLNKYEKPKTIYFLPVFAETETGKIKRSEILRSL